MNLTVVIAAYNEADNIGPLTSRLVATLSAMKSTCWRIVYVIEGEDGTLQKAQAFAARYPQITILYNAAPSGLGNAFRQGFAAIPQDTDLVITMDADLNHQPEEIPRLVRSQRRREVDIVIGSRKVAGSTVEQAPAWKALVSDVVNRCMRHMMGMDIGDQTSGFRVYRYSALQSLKFRNSGFAFLPEILLQARKLGLRIHEEPIRFVFRGAGESKMALAPTAVSYVRLFLRHGIPFASAIALLLILLAFLVRLAMAYPTHALDGDSDAVLAGLCAGEVLQGQHPLFFPGGYRLSSQSCYPTAAFFSILGMSRATLALTGLLFGTVLTVVVYMALRAAVGRRLSPAVLVLFVTPPAFLLTMTCIAYGYTEILIWCVATLWMAAVVAFRRNVSLRWFFFLGASAGLALWASIQSLMILFPLGVVILAGRFVRTRRQLAAAVCGLLIGALPLVYFLAVGGISLYTSSFSVQPVKTAAQFAANLRYTLRVNIPELLVGQSIPMSIASLVGIQFIAYSALLIAAAIIVIRVLIRREPADRAFGFAALALLICVTGLMLYSISGAGSIRGATWRYVLPMYLMVPLSALAVLLRLRHRARTFTVALVVLVSLANIRAYPIFGDPARKALEAQAASQDRLIAFLIRKDIHAVIGNYWVSYNVNFHSRGTITGIPEHPAYDYVNVERKIAGNWEKWALLDSDIGHLKQWQARLRLAGQIVTFKPGLHALIPAVNPPPMPAWLFIRQARDAYPRQ